MGAHALPEMVAHALPERGNQKKRESELLRWSVKVLGAELVQRLYAQGLAGPNVALPVEPVVANLTSRSCRQADIESDWARHWCRALSTIPFYHRKLWEDCFILQALWEAGMMEPGRRAIAFAVGQEPLPAILASRGVAVLATDIDADDRRARDWIDTGQHIASTDALYRPHLQDRADFDTLVRFQSADMSSLPPALQDASYDMLWSACAMEHLGTIEAGLSFVQTAMGCLKPGGVAVHTTELNLVADGETLTSGSTVLYQLRHFEELARRLGADGHTMLPIDLLHNAQILDQFVDLPPFEEGRVPLGFLSPPHLRLSIAGFPSTSFGIIIRKGG
jgi:2-polyprenyl-3-methyl-5-hydroxy-6-metoxy-1,4-benzoquinol methylase